MNMNRWSRLFRWQRVNKIVGEEENMGQESMEKKKEDTPRIKWKDLVVDPSEEFYYIWLQIMILPICYNWVIIILRSCFYTIEDMYFAVWLSLDYICDLFYVLDTVIGFRTGFLEQGILVRDVSSLKKRYMRSSRFKLDIASLLPTDLLYLKLGIHTPLVRINRFLRIGRMNEALDRMETRTAYPNTFRVAKLMLYIFVLIHWNACVYFSLSNYVGFGSDPFVYPNISDPEFASVRRQYFHSFWLSTLVLISIGDLPAPESEEGYLFMIADMLIAVLVFASVVGSMGDVVSSLRNRDNVFFPDHELVKGYLRSRHISKELQKRVNDWYQHLHINKKITRENEILQHLPITLQTATAKGDVGHEMYIIKEGKLAVVADDGVTQFAVLGDGNFFGEISILNIKGNKSGNRRTANIRSIGYSDLFSLSKEDLTETLQEFPAAKRLLEEKGRQILTKMGMLEETVEGEEETEKTEEKVTRIEASLETLQTKMARLIAELESSARKMMQRVEQLELQTEGWEGFVAEGAQGEMEEKQKMKERETGDGEGEGEKEKEKEDEPVVEGERGEGDGGEEGLGENGAGGRKIN
ncbi:hypothetical protein DNTS_013711 [Danionella cerebrum]|uniref:Cyclic nucleotide-binding domain-containing protein n=1 Tax=Danionella cerebrum TaxID=2873325 RepID=A0A553R4U1_9TELE|nr:hypothetical protein DNTS_013711 [Danionella translucida]